MRPGTNITAKARDILIRCRADGPRLYLPDGPRLDPKVYAQVKRVLTEAGGNWAGGQVQAFVFGEDAAAVMATIVTANRVVSATSQDQWFESPPGVVRRLIEAALLVPGMEVLEPEAGRGAIAQELAAACCTVDCVEIDPVRASAIQSAGYARKLIVGDFLAIPPVPGTYDAVIMNPPFAGHADERHVYHALAMLRPGGSLVSLMGAGIRYRDNHRAKLIRNLAGGAIDDLPADTFESVGAEMATCIVVIRTGGRRMSADPRRVSLHGADPAVPAFTPATAPRGSYVAWDASWRRDRTFHFAGDCLGCGGRTWQHDDGEGTAFGEHSYCALTRQNFPDDMAGQVPGDREWPECLVCRHDRTRHGRAVQAALSALSPPVDDRGDAVLF